MRRKSLKKVFSYFCFFVFALWISTVSSTISVQASSTTISYSIDKDSLSTGTYFDISVNIKNVSNLYGATLDFKYDPTLLNIVGIEKGTIFNNQDVNSAILVDNRSTGYISFSALLKGNRTGLTSTASTLFVIKAQALRSGSMTLQTISENSGLSNPGNNIRIKLADDSAVTKPISYTASPFVLSIGSREFSRYAGSNRYSTSVEISKAGWSQSDYIVIATGQDYPDALCATPLAGKYNAPILLSYSTALDPSVEQEIKRLKAKTAFIVGGTGVISPIVENKLKSLGLNVTRIAGANRYETSAQVAKHLSSSQTAFVVTGTNYPDALSIASLAAYKKAPILLTGPQAMDPSVKKIIANGVIKNTYVIGGPALINDTLMKTFPNPKRIYGINRYETNALILSSFAADFNFTNAFVATGTHFADALSSSALAGSYGAPIILTSPDMSNNIITKLSARKSEVKKIYLLGGPTVVSEDIARKIFD
ncbi:cell wall-binding repeat-containing protein [Clostridium thermarum]|uniref:cell wall-binding repeat-containing protein n=1 Tax=Clostridium thermarum TaxID=1716543 RepID=UPI0013D663AF|nr:cell wall-binding repeat-containing protein [Clostridium thermarum]